METGWDGMGGAQTQSAKEFVGHRRTRTDEAQRGAGGIRGSVGEPISVVASWRRSLGSRSSQDSMAAHTFPVFTSCVDLPEVPFRYIFLRLAAAAVAAPSSGAPVRLSRNHVTLSARTSCRAKSREGSNSRRLFWELDKYARPLPARTKRELAQTLARAYHETAVARLVAEAQLARERTQFRLMTARANLKNNKAALLKVLVETLRMNDAHAKSVLLKMTSGAGQLGQLLVTRCPRRVPPDHHVPTITSLEERPGPSARAQGTPD